MKALALALLVAPSVALAFPTGNQFDGDPLQEDAAGGLAFTGAPRFAGHTCAVCHTDAPRRIGLELQADKPELFSDGWKANTQYHLRVVIDNDWAGKQFKANGDTCGDPDVTPYRACDVNGFGLELDDSKGHPTGKFTPYAGTACVMTPDPDVYVLKDGSAVMHQGTHHAITSWDLCWTAPAAGTGVITAYVTAVDGNGGDGTAKWPSDAINDDVAEGTVPIAEAGTPPPHDVGGCDAGQGAGLGVVVALALLLVRRKRIATIALLASLGGCVHVRPRQRGTLAHRNMKFAPDPTEDELDLHMQEAREGSSGGYGSSGGGCGCN